MKIKQLLVAMVGVSSCLMAMTVLAALPYVSLHVFNTKKGHSGKEYGLDDLKIQVPGSTTWFPIGKGENKLFENFNIATGSTPITLHFHAKGISSCGLIYDISSTGSGRAALDTCKDDGVGFSIESKRVNPDYDNYNVTLFVYKNSAPK